MNKQAGKRQQRTLQGDVLIPLDTAEERRLQRAAKDRQLTRISKGLYVNAVDPQDLATDTPGPVALLVRRNWQQIAGHMFPHAVVSHRSALAGGITPDNELMFGFQVARASNQELNHVGQYDRLSLLHRYKTRHLQDEAPKF